MPFLKFFFISTLIFVHPTMLPNSLALFSNLTLHRYIFSLHCFQIQYLDSVTLSNTYPFVFTLPLSSVSFLNSVCFSNIYCHTPLSKTITLLFPTFAIIYFFCYILCQINLSFCAISLHFMQTALHYLHASRFPPSTLLHPKIILHLHYMISF